MKQQVTKQRAMQQDARVEQDSLAPIPVDGLSLEEEVELLRADNPGQIWRWLGTIAVVGLIGTFTVQAMDAAEARDDARATMSRLTGTKLDAFLDCALPDARPVHITSREQLHSLLERQLVVDRTSFGTRVQGCLPDLLAFNRGLASMPVPMEVEREHRHMAATASALYERAEAMAKGLSENPNMDYARSTGLIDRVASAHAMLIEAKRVWNTEMAF